MNTQLELLYEDDDVVAVNKPGGLLVHRSRESADRIVLLQELRNQVGRHVYPVHRLDRASSGVIVFAYSSPTARALQESLGSPDAVKEYVTLVRGSAPEHAVTERPLTADNGVKKAARTELWRIAELSGLSLLRVRINTGRRHQIRRHLSHLKHQVLGDTTYGKGRINRHFRTVYGLPRLFLHACRLDIKHPTTSGRLVIRAPLQEDLREFLSRLPDCPRDVLGL